MAIRRRRTRARLGYPDGCQAQAALRSMSNQTEPQDDAGCQRRCSARGAFWSEGNGGDDDVRPSCHMRRNQEQIASARRAIRGGRGDGACGLSQSSLSEIAVTNATAKLTLGKVMRGSGRLRTSLKREHQSSRGLKRHSAPKLAGARAASRLRAGTNNRFLTASQRLH